MTTRCPQVPVPGTEGRAPQGRVVGWPWLGSRVPRGPLKDPFILCPVAQQLQGLLLNEADARTRGPSDAAMSGGPPGATCAAARTFKAKLQISFS